MLSEAGSENIEDTNPAVVNPEGVEYLFDEGTTVAGKPELVLLTPQASLQARLSGGVAIINRADAAIRAARTLRRLGIRSVGIYTPFDGPAAPHVLACDASIPVSSYVNREEVLSAIIASGCNAVLPGWGFLSEVRFIAHSVSKSTRPSSFRVDISVMYINSWVIKTFRLIIGPVSSKLCNCVLV